MRRIAVILAMLAVTLWVATWAMLYDGTAHPALIAAAATLTVTALVAGVVRRPRPRMLTVCRDCRGGISPYPELGFCWHCGSTRGFTTQAS